MIDYEVLIALYASQYLQGKRELPATLVSTSPAFGKVYNVEFQKYQHGAWQVTAESLEAWLAPMKTANARRVYVQQISNASGELEQHYVTGFTNAVFWGLVVEYPTHNEVWLPRNEQRKLDPKRFLTRVYRRVEGDLPALVGTIDSAKTLLRKALIDIQPIARKLSPDNWLKKFEVAVEQLDASAPSQWRMNEALELVSTLETRQLLAAGIQAWVFGGMGSWGDIGGLTHETIDEYNRTSDVLYEAVMISMQVAIDFATRNE